MDVHDAIVIGGGPAGLQAALTLGRMHRRTLLLDSGRYRNDPADAMHNLITHDGRLPAEFRSTARADLAAYDDVEVRRTAATLVKADGDTFVVEAEGVHRARAVVLATGLTDALPAKPGLAELFGTVVAHCPYCHGHEFGGGHVAVLGSAPHVAMTAMLVRRIAGRLSVFADGAELDPDLRAMLEGQGVTVRTEGVTGLRRSATGATVSFESGPAEEVAGIFVATTLTQAAPFADQLGLELLPDGCVEVDAFGRTSVPGVYAAGDLAHSSAYPMPLASVGSAVSAGLLAASTLHATLTAAEVGIRLPF